MDGHDLYLRSNTAAFLGGACPICAVPPHRPDHGNHHLAAPPGPARRRTPGIDSAGGVKRSIRTARDDWASMSIVCGVPKPWGNIGVVFVAYALLHLTCLPAVSDRTKGLIQTIGD